MKEKDEGERAKGNPALKPDCCAADPISHLVNSHTRLIEFLEAQSKSDKQVLHEIAIRVSQTDMAKAQVWSTQ